jgi:proteasome lid subunit RPN8/RPN11
MIRHALWCRPYECCGLIAMDAEQRIRMVYPLSNAQESAVSFTIEPTEHFGALTHAETRGWEIGGVFHSHPGGNATLSPIDLTQPHDPAWVHVVVGLRPDIQIRAWCIREGNPVELTVV